MLKPVILLALQINSWFRYRIECARSVRINAPQQWLTTLIGLANKKLEENSRADAEINCKNNIKVTKIYF